MQYSLAAAYAFRGVARITKNDYEKGIADLNNAIQIDPSLAFAYAGRGTAHVGKENYDKALADFDRAIQIDPSLAFAYAGRGTAHVGKENYDKALADFDRAIRLNPVDGHAYRNRALAHFGKGDIDNAIVDLDKAIKLYPDNARAYYGRGLVYDARGDPAKAFIDLKVALRLAPTGNPLKTLILADISEIERKLANPDQPTNEPIPRPATVPAPIEPGRRVFSVGDGAVVEVTVREIDGQKFNVVRVEGDFKPGDDKSFKQALLTVDGAVVVSFESPGGDLDAGMEIGRTIWTNQFMTVVEDGTCASACALAWLAGRPRYATRNANIGFHAPTRTDDPDRLADSVGSAFVGGYLTELGFTSGAIAFMTEQGPDDMNWLSSDKARGLGIYVEDWQ